MDQYAGVFLTLVAFSHVSTVGWIIFKYPKDVTYYEENPAETPTWFKSKYYYYIRHLYFVVTTGTTIGYGDIVPDKDYNVELIFGMIVELLGLSILGIMWTLNNILLANFNAQSEKIEENMMNFEEWFNKLERNSRAEFPYLFVKQLYLFFHRLFKLEVDTVLYEGEYLEQLPLKVAKLLEFKYHEARPSPFESMFERYDKEMCVEIVKACEQTSFLPGTVIIHRGHLCPGVYWIASGTVQCIYLHNDQVIEELSAGDSFGSYCILDQPSRESYICQDVCLIHFLPKEKLNEILDKFGVESLLFKEEAQDEFNYIQEKRLTFKAALEMGNS